MARKSKYDKQSSEKQTATRMYHAGIYLRRSCTDNEEKDIASLRSQRMICLNFLKDNLDIIPCCTYIDDGYSGGNFHRPDFQRMLSDINNGHIDCVVVKDLSRFGRNYIEVENYLTVQFPSLGVRFISIGEQYDSLLDENTGNNNSIILSFCNILNEYYIRDISKKTKSIVYAKMYEGTYLPAGSVIPYGYLRDAKNKTYQIDEEVAPIIRRIFTMRSEGESIRAIADTLNAEKVSTVGQRKYALYGGRRPSEKWNSTHVKMILENQTYFGCRVHKYLTDENERKSHIIENAHPPIVSKELFDSVQTESKPPRRNNHNPDVNTQYDDDCRAFLEGKVFCGDCGAVMKSLTAKSYKHGIEKTVLIFQSSCCHFRRLSHNWAYRSVSAAVKSQLDCTDEITLIKKTVAASKKSGAYKLLMRKKRSVQLKVKNAGGWLERLLDDYMNGILDRDEYLYAKQVYRQKYDDILAEEAKVNHEIQEYQAALNAAQSWILNVEGFEDNQDMTDELLATVISEIKVFKRHNLEITMSYQDVFQRIEQYARRG